MSAVRAAPAPPPAVAPVAMGDSEPLAMGDSEADPSSVHASRAMRARSHQRQKDGQGSPRLSKLPMQATSPSGGKPTEKSAESTPAATPAAAKLTPQKTKYNVPFHKKIINCINERAAMVLGGTAVGRALVQGHEDCVYSICSSPDGTCCASRRAALACFVCFLRRRA